ncbi:UvrD-helicase domain-containing protein [Aquimarina spinulae]|uniref:UvrD-helicase domain-containing protein n=1 Tax=Aquimarina spinulae TaxID=1192023 RepID=UPI000D55D92D|nr:UvrD-helicase domain-containing protein [Aquimarina spinulae]
MFDVQNFVSKRKSLLIAPAGYGKTHSISESLKNTKGRQLILTHTHAGVSSIKEKLKKAQIANHNFNVETITSFAQKYVLSFYINKDEIPDQEDSNAYYPFIIKEAANIIKLKPIIEVISSTYSGLFVDEYQDCTVEQHKLILSLSNLLPTRILGDHLQGIFDFNNGNLVDFNHKSMKEFNSNLFKLETPWRWYNNSRKDLGDDLKAIRKKLLNKENIDLRIYESIETHVFNENELSGFKANKYSRFMWTVISKDNPLLMHPDSTSINPRLSMIRKFNNNFSLLESIDNKDFYKFSKEIDNANTDNITSIIIKLSLSVFKKTEIRKWLTDNGVKAKRGEEEKTLIAPLKANFETLKSNKSFLIISDSLEIIKNSLNIPCYRKELLKSIIDALLDAHFNDITVYESMVNRRNKTRRMGKKIYGNCIGTTLLTKGLEFDTVVILNAHSFNCPKHLYVALTRASKRLIVITTNPVLNPY